MAYNPFNIFRRNQRAIFAVITVFVMFTFVLSSGLSGGADFFDWLPNALRKGQRGDLYCTIDGTKVYAQDTTQLHRQRLMAQKFMATAAGETVQNLYRVLSDQMAKADPKYGDIMRQAVQNPMFMSILPRMIAEDPNAKPADKDLGKTIEAILAIGQAAGQISAVPNRADNPRDQIEFMLWEKKAKELGIEFGDEDVKALVQREFMGMLQPDAERQVWDRLRGEGRGVSVSAVLHTLGEEFKVRAAQTALLGPLVNRPDRTLTAPPVFDPPYELFEFFRDKTSATSYEALAVPVAAFMSKVTATPTEDELQRLFNARKDYEPDPAREEPGFRDPRKIKVEWLSATGEEPYYLTAAKEQLVKGPVAAVVVPPTLGAWGTVSVAAFAATDPAVRREYERTVDTHQSALARGGWGGGGLFVTPADLLDTSAVRPQTLAAAAGGAVAALAGGNGLLPMDLTYSAVVALEQRDRVKAGAPVVLGAVPGPGLFATAVGAVAASTAATPAALPVEAVKPELLKTLTETKARELAIADLKKLKADVAKLSDNGRAKDKAAAKAAVAEFVKSRGLKTGATADFASEWTIADDPGMAPLKALTDKGDPHALLRGSAPVQFGQRFFWATPAQSAGPARSATTGTYAPEFYPDAEPRPAAPFPGAKPDPIFLTWRTEDKAARAVSYAEAKPRVVEAWKEAKARELAKAEADRLAAEIKNKPSTSPIGLRMEMEDMRAALQARTTDPKARERVKLFEVKDVAPHPITIDFTRGNAGWTAQRFQVAPSANIPYPTPEMTTRLLDDRTKEPRTVAVLPDQPKDTYYVFALADRRERGESDYRQHMFESAGGMGGGGVVRQEVRGAYLRDAMTKAKDSVVGLLKKEFHYVETEEQKAKLDDRERRGEE